MQGVPEPPSTIRHKPLRGFAAGARPLVLRQPLLDLSSGGLRAITGIDSRSTPRSNVVYVISPSLHHLAPFGEVFSAVVRSANFIGFLVRKLAFDNVFIKPQHLVENSRGRCAKTVYRGAPMVAQTVQCVEHRVFAHWLLRVPFIGKYPSRTAGQHSYFH